MMSGLSVRRVALRRGIRLEQLTVAWMLIEATLAIGAGILARSVLLTAFGVDSVVELLSGITLLWRLRAEQRGEEEVRVSAAEKRAIQISAVLLVLLCGYVIASSAAGLLFGFEPHGSWLGIGVSAAALVAMPWLAWRKRVANRAINSSALRADIAESVTCAYLAATTLGGVFLNAVTGWWWVEYVAAVVLLVWLVPEAREAVEAALEGKIRHEGD